MRQAESAWSDTRDNLQELCTKYQRAADVWRRYRDASDAVRVWADEQMSTLGALQPLDAAKQVEVCIAVFAQCFSVTAILFVAAKSVPVSLLAA